MYAPAFDRSMEEPVAGAIAVPPAAGWSSPRATTCSWTTALGGGAGAAATRRGSSTWTPSVRLAGWPPGTSRFGKAPEQAAGVGDGQRRANAALVAGTAHRADLVVRLAEPPPL